MGALDIYLLAAVDWTLAKASQYKIRTGETEIGMIHNNKCFGVDIHGTSVKNLASAKVGKWQSYPLVFYDCHNNQDSHSFMDIELILICFSNHSHSRHLYAGIQRVHASRVQGSSIRHQESAMAFVQLQERCCSAAAAFNRVGKRCALHKSIAGE